MTEFITKFDTMLAAQWAVATDPIMWLFVVALFCTLLACYWIMDRV
jgi:hypothetical protein